MKIVLVLIGLVTLSIGPLTPRVAAKKLDEFQRKELQDARQERRDQKAELQQEERDKQEDEYERLREGGAPRRHVDEDTGDEDADFGAD